MSYLNVLREQLLRSIWQDMPEGAEIDFSLPPTTAYCVVVHPDGDSTRIPMEVGGHAFSLSDAPADGTDTRPPALPSLSGPASGAAQLQFANPASPPYVEARTKSKPCLPCYEARKKCEGGIPCNRCSSRKGLQCTTRSKPDSSETAPGQAFASYPQYGASDG